MLCFCFSGEIIFENLRLYIQKTVMEEYPEATLNPSIILIDFGEALGELN